MTHKGKAGLGLQFPELTGPKSGLALLEVARHCKPQLEAPLASGLDRFDTEDGALFVAATGVGDDLQFRRAFWLPERVSGRKLASIVDGLNGGVQAQR